MKGSTALVLGGKTGLLGQALMGALDAAGCQATALGRKDGDICHPDFLQEHVAKLNPDFIFNTIAYTAVDLAEDHEEEADALNRAFPLMLGRLVRDTKIHLVHYSTDFVFNGKKNQPYEENDATAPLCVYGATKLAGEQALLGLNLPNCTIVRTAWLFGPGRKNFISVILAKAAENSSIHVVHDQIGSPTYSVDLAQYSVALAKVRPQGLVHVVNSGQASWCELASEAVSQSGVGQSGLLCSVDPITSAQWPQKAIRPAFSPLSTKRFTELTGITPRPWPQALREYLLLCCSAEPTSSAH